MKKLIFVFISFFLTLYACQNESSSLGEDLVNTSFRNIVTDTCTIQFSTILVDSVETLGDTICQIGYIQDATFGTVKSSYYAEFEVNSFTPTSTSRYQCDSIKLLFTPSGHYWGDTLTVQTIDVYEIAQEFYLEDDESFYNVSSWPIEDTPLFSFTYLPQPGKKWELDVNMPLEFGEKLLEDIVNEEDYFDSQEDFRTYFHGLAFVPRDGGNCIMGFVVNDESTCIKLYYREFADAPIESELVFPVNTSEYAFTRVEHDRTGTPIESLPGGGALNPTSSTQLNHKGYLQGLTGIYNVIEFPHLNNLMQEGDIVSIESAMLYLYPEQGTYNVVNQLPSTLRLYTADENNTIIDQIYDSMGTTIQDGSLTVDYVHGEETYYSFDITDFLQDNLGTWGINREKLFLILDDNDFTCTYDQVVFGNDPNDDDTGQMKLYVRLKAYNKSGNSPIISHSSSSDE